MVPNLLNIFAFQLIYGKLGHKDPILNPYAPGAGTPPPELAGRNELLERARIAFGRVQAGRAAKSFIAVGLRGVGKTVLLAESRLLAEQVEFRICFIEAQEGKRLHEILLPQLRRILLELDRIGKLTAEVKRALRVLKSFISRFRVSYGGAELSLDIDPEQGWADSGDLDTDLPELFAAIGRAVAAHNSAVALLIDELQYLSLKDLGAVIMALHRCAQERLPVLMVAAGLPTHGYPYFIQEWAYHAWNTAAGPKITASDVQAAGTEAILRMDESFFRVGFDRLTPREKDYLRAMADLGPGILRAGDIADRLHIKAPSVAPVRSGLIDKGMIYRPRHGGTAFTVPLFDEFLCRIIPDWRTPYHRRDHA
jgi:AAA ATPase domain